MTEQIFRKRGSELLMAGVEEIVFTLDVKGNIKFINQAGERFCGLGSEELLRMNVLDFLPGHSARELWAIAKRSIRQRFGTVFEVEITNSHGRQVRIETSIDAVRRPDQTLEIHGIAFAPRELVATQSPRQRCLDQRFTFQLPEPLSSQVAVDSPGYK